MRAPAKSREPRAVSLEALVLPQYEATDAYLQGTKFLTPTKVVR